MHALVSHLRVRHKSPEQWQCGDDQACTSRRGRCQTLGPEQAPLVNGTEDPEPQTAVKDLARNAFIPEHGVAMVMAFGTQRL